MQATSESRGVGVAATVLVLSGIVFLPLCGVVLSGRDPRFLLAFPPPLKVPTDYPAFSWIAVCSLLAAFAAFLASWAGRHRAPGRVQPTPGTVMERTGYPHWIWPALVWMLAWWLVAWTRIPGFEPIQRFTFFPLWLGFVVVLNAVAQGRTGTCLMTRAPRVWLMLFGASAGFWWLFEWLNRFVQNWHYLGVERFDPATYVLHASLCFSTVLPAVEAMAEVLASFRVLERRFGVGPAWGWLGRRSAGWLLVGLGAVGLLLTGVYPQAFYPALWSAPLALYFGVEILRGRKGLTGQLMRGDWRTAGTWMLAALVCGFFWELWNSLSLAKWIYTVPGVERWFVFEMPALGYLGYLPFGIECLLICRYLAAREALER